MAKPDLKQRLLKWSLIIGLPLLVILVLVVFMMLDYDKTFRPSIWLSQPFYLLLGAIIGVMVIFIFKMLTKKDQDDE